MPTNDRYYIMVLTSTFSFISRSLHRKINYYTVYCTAAKKKQPMRPYDVWRFERHCCNIKRGLQYEIVFNPYKTVTITNLSKRGLKITQGGSKNKQIFCTAFRMNEILNLKALIECFYKRPHVNWLLKMQKTVPFFLYYSEVKNIILFNGLETRFCFC